MAHLIPKQPNWDGKDGRVAERELFEALARLDDDHWVYHAYDYVSGEPLRDREADILVLHRRKGLLVFECKGKGVRRDGSGQWWRGDERLKKSPFRQVADTEHRLVTLLEEHARELLGWSSLPLGHRRAVVFPRARARDVNPPPDVPRAIVLDRDDLPRIEARVSALYGHWGTTDKPGLDPSDFKRFRRQVLCPEFKIVEALGSGPSSRRGRSARACRGASTRCTSTACATAPTRFWA